MSRCLLSHNLPLPESLLLPMMVFLTLASELADLSSVVARWGNALILVKLLQASSFRLKTQDPSLSFPVTASFSAVQFGEPGLASPLLA